MFQKKAPIGVEPEPGEEGVAPITDVMKPMKKKKKAPKKHGAHDAKDKKGKTAAMLGKKVGMGSIAEDIFNAPKRKPGNEFVSGNKGGALQFVPEQKKLGI
jgi:hypothetical protein